jgi:hypothetical protein
MSLWQTSGLIFISVIPLGILLRLMAESIIPKIRHMKWTSESIKIMKIVKSENTFLFLLLMIEGIISNLSLLTFIVAIPLYFIFGI